ncbi:MAG: hypothetical protein ACI9WU_003650 [Myxococcota bacterium]|jgi:hypothetical protein
MLLAPAKGDPQVPVTAQRGGCPHNLPKNAAHHSEQMVHFFRTGEIIDVCGGDGCSPD